MKNNQTRFLAVMVIALVVFSVIAFAVPFEKNGVFWVSFVFGVIAILAQAYVMKVAFGGAEDAKSKFYGFPIAKIGICYMLIQLVVSIAFMACAWIAPVWLAVVVDVVILGLAAVGLIASEATRDEVVRQDVKVATDTSCITSLRALSAALVGQCTDPEVKKEVSKIADELKYSDPVSKPELAEVETELKMKLSSLQTAIKSGNKDVIIDSCKDLSAKLVERNTLCKALKK